MSSFKSLKLALILMLPFIYFKMLPNNFKSKALKKAKGNYNESTSLPNACKEELSWWVENVESTENNNNFYYSGTGGQAVKALDPGSRGPGFDSHIAGHL